MSPDANPTLAAAIAALEAGLAAQPRRPFVFGLCGAQGSGKSTLAGALAERFEAKGVRTAVLSIDDLYLTKAERERLAKEVHPLLGTRGVPGTHDVALGLDLLRALDEGRPAALPRFDKARDDRAPESDWATVSAGVELLIFEGWCVGAVPQPEEALAEPVNALERDEDPDGRWRRHVNAALAGDYQALFGRIDLLMLLAAPGFEVVHGWRIQQERELEARAGRKVMSDEEIGRFIQHYERITRHILTEMPGRADLVAALGPDRSLTALQRR